MDPGERRQQTVLLVEPERQLAGIIGIALRESRYVVTEVDTGREALDLLEVQYPDAIVMDPDLSDGAGDALVERARQIRFQDGRDVVNVIISTMDWAEVVQRYGPSVRNYLAKPFDPWDLVRLLDRELEGHRE